MTTWFTSDLHLGHANLLHLYQPNRTWSSVEEMDAALIAEWREKVRPSDTVFFLGDLTLKTSPLEVMPLLRQLTGKVRMVLGNHDRWIKKVGPLPRNITVVCEDNTMKKIGVHGVSLLVCHYPIANWPGQWKDVYHIHGHSHGNGESMPGRLDVSWDAHNKILSWDEVKQLLEQHDGRI